MFQLKVHENHRTGLIVTCDVCGAEITAASRANLLWEPRDGEQAGDTHEFILVCKGQDCDRKMERERGHHYWQPLDAAIVFLINNLRVDLDSARRTADILSSL